MSGGRYEVRLTNSYSSISLAVLIAFLLFWMQSGWYRIDCALGVKSACELISAEYAEGRP